MLSVVIMWSHPVRNIPYFTTSARQEQPRMYARAMRGVALCSRVGFRASERGRYHTCASPACVVVFAGTAPAETRQLEERGGLTAESPEPHARRSLPALSTKGETRLLRPLFQLKESSGPD
ncbi:hypothetical protein COCON_G00068420 [Conger conger]|uniref:Uncharacterized protein n=1 Tax=Conger conger TaxID=82655 RepID=A0A9Q1DST9_CONCO|nr:hypothetical protein COCON_G00068420 [Conger conger]